MSISHYDVVGNSIVILAAVMSRVHRVHILIPVDDGQTVSPEGKHRGERYASTRKNLSRQLNVELVEDLLVMHQGVLRIKRRVKF